MSSGINQNNVLIQLQHFRHAQPADGALLESVQKNELRLLASSTVVVVAETVGLDEVL